mgnify:CR=1 FL=1
MMFWLTSWKSIQEIFDTKNSLCSVNQRLLPQNSFKNSILQWHTPFKGESL